MFMKEVFEQFLAEQKSQLAPKTYEDYESVIDLFKYQLNNSAWNTFDDGDKASNAAKKQEKSFIDLYDHTHIEEHIREFLEEFVPQKVMAGNEFISTTCPRVIRKLLRWMNKKNLVELTHEDIKKICENQLWENTMRAIRL